MNPGNDNPAARADDCMDAGRSGPSGPSRGITPSLEGRGRATPGAVAEFYLCLARAFLPPHTDNDHRALAVYLADDLADLAGETGYPIAEPLAQLRAAFDALPGPLALLQLYSKLFLTPPTPVALNTGRYLDGTVMGGSVQAIEGWYRRRGLERTESFHDLPDHVALQLEFVARLFAGAAAARQAGDDAEARQLEAEARAFLGAFVVHWLPGFCAALERTLAQHRLPAPYLYLAHILCAAVECDATAGIPQAAVGASHIHGCAHRRERPDARAVAGNRPRAGGPRPVRRAPGRSARRTRRGARVHAAYATGSQTFSRRLAPSARGECSGSLPWRRATPSSEAKLLRREAPGRHKKPCSLSRLATTAESAIATRGGGHSERAACRCKGYRLP